MSVAYEDRLNRLVNSIEKLVGEFKLTHNCDQIFHAIDNLYTRTPRSRDADDTILTEIEHEVRFFESKHDATTAPKLCAEYLDWLMRCPIHKSTFEFTISSQNTADVVAVYKKEKEIEDSPVPLGIDSPNKCKNCGANAIPVEVQNRSLDEGPGFKDVCTAKCKGKKR